MKHLCLFILLWAATLHLSAQPLFFPSPTFQDSVYRDFDFWIGEWEVALRARQPDLSWALIKRATAHIFPVLQGKAILELWSEDTTAITGTRGFSLRYYNPQSGKWDLFLNWPRQGYSRTALFTGMKDHDRFDFSVRFPADDSTFMIAKYTFSDVTPTALRWHDSYSRDEGRNWSHNWIMNFYRTRQLPVRWQVDQMPTYLEGKLCTAPEFVQLQAWQEVNSLRWLEEQWQVQSYPILDGCALLYLAKRLVDNEVQEKLLFLTYNTVQQQYDLVVLDTDEEPANWYRGVWEDEGISLFIGETEQVYSLNVEGKVITLEE